MARSPSGRIWLLIGGIGSAAMALFHLGIIVVGASAYRRFGGASLAARAEAGSFVPAAMLLAIALGFAIFALYAFAGARLEPRLPFLRTGLILIGSLYGIHGLFLVPELVARLRHAPSVAPSNMGIDALFLAMALPYAIGTATAWPELGERSRRTDNGELIKREHG